VADDETGLIQKGARITSKLLVKVNLDGLLIDGSLPWVNAGNLGDTEGVRGLVMNAYILELFCERLFRFYDKIDFTRIRQKRNCSIPTRRKEVLSGPPQGRLRGSTGYSQTTLAATRNRTP